MSLPTYLNRTVISNVSSNPVNIHFIPRAGLKVIPPAGSIEILGFLDVTLASGAGRYTRSRELASMQKLVDDGIITVTNVPGT